MFPEKVRESAGEKVVEHYSKEKNERWLSTLSRRPEYHKKTSEAARLALDLIEIKKKRAAALKRLEGSRLAAQPKKKARS